MKYVYLSPSYAVRNEQSASFLMRVDSILDKKKSDFAPFCIPPFIGYILAHVGDSPYDMSVEMIAETLNVSIKAIDHFINQILENKEPMEFKVSDTATVVFPVGLLQTGAEKPFQNVYQDSGFNPGNDFNIKRPQAPLSVNLMVTTKCITDCIYCYADRTLAPLMSTDKIISLIDEMHRQGTINVTLTGGDIFAHPDWRIILMEMRKHAYKPLLSTKTPLTSEDIDYLKELGYDEIQFSLNSANPYILPGLISVGKDYLQRVQCFMETSSNLGLKVMIRSVLTKSNAGEPEILKLYEFLCTFDCVKEWVLTPAFFSEYKKKHYKDLEPNQDQLISIFNFTKRADLKFRVGLNKINGNGYELKRFKTVSEYVKGNQICLANTTSLSILANGDCSVCEMLYNSPEYILGNVGSLTIEEIWNSEKALKLYQLKQQASAKASPCSECKVFSECRNGFGKRICYLDIHKSGKSKDFPDPRCPEAETIDIIL